MSRRTSKQRRSARRRRRYVQTRKNAAYVKAVTAEILTWAQTMIKAFGRR